jgi:hypothetical protein
MEPITKDNDDPSHIWTKEEIIECGVCDSNDDEEPDFERDEVNDIISVGGQDEYDADPDVLTNDTNDFEDGNISSIINEIKEENNELAIEPTVEPVIEPLIEPTVELVIEPLIEPLIEPVIEPTVELVIEPVIEPLIEPLIEPVLEPLIEPVLEPESDISLPLNIEKKEEKEEKEEDEEKDEPVINAVIGNLALDESIIEESSPKNLNVDENNLPFIDLEKEEKQDLKEDPIVQDITDNLVVEPLPHVDNILPIIDLEKEEKEEKDDPTENELIEERGSLSRRDIATFEAPSAKKFKWKAWFQSLWFWT